MPSPKAKRLTKMRLDEVSLVDAGANQHARAVIVKRAHHATPNEEADMPQLQQVDDVNDVGGVSGGDDEFEYVLVDEDGNEIELADGDDDGDDGDDDELSAVEEAELEDDLDQ